jgi:hypothetical protein
MDSWLALHLEDERCRTRVLGKSGEWRASHGPHGDLTGASEARTARIHLHGHRDTRGGGVDEPQAHGAADLETNGARTGGGQDGGSGGRLRPSLHHPSGQNRTRSQSFIYSFLGPVRQQTAPRKSGAPLRSDPVSDLRIGSSESGTFGWLRSPIAWAASPLKRNGACFKWYSGRPAHVELNIDGL